jgi:hypothetical protein
MRLTENLYRDVGHSGSAAIEINAPGSGTAWVNRQPDYWQYLILRDRGGFDWLNSALAKLANIATGQDRAYAELALRQACHISPAEPRIKRAPGGGVVIEHRSETDDLGLIIEGYTGVIVRVADTFRVNTQFDLTPKSINELLVRYVFELNLLQVSTGKRDNRWLSGFLKTL